MRPLRLACFALLVGVLTNCVAYGQPPGYGSPQPQPQSDPYSRGYDDRYNDDRYYGAPAPRVEVGFFYDELSPYGDWVRTRDYGWAWFPRDVHPYWRPYHDGRWVITEYGWTWISYEPFGWATYHYGRWARDPRFGWIWIPGTVWGPAWVSWQYGGGYVGWAPLPPAVGFEIGIGLRLGGFDLRLGIRPDYYNFVPESRFLDPRLSGHYLPSARNVTIINNTTNITNYTYIDNRVINQGVDRRRIERATGSRVQQRRVAEVRTQVRTEVATEEVRIYRPEKQKLDTVRGGKREKAEQRAEPRQQTRTDQRPAAERRDAPEIVVAPRVDRAPRPDTRQIEQRERREKQELERHLAAEKQKIEKLHRDEDAKVRAQAERAKESNAKARAQTERAEVEKRHQAEREALRREEREAAQQLEARQKAKREAVVAEPPAKAEPQGKAKAEQAKAEKAKADKAKAAKAKAEKAKAEKAKKGRGQQEKPEPPPAAPGAGSS